MASSSRMDVMTIDKYILYGDPIGKGSYGHVYKCRLLAEAPSSSSGGMPRLVGKFVLQGDPGGDASERRKYEDARREASLLSSLEHENIVTLVDLVVAPGVVLFVMPHFIDGDLS